MSERESSDQRQTHPPEMDTMATEIQEPWRGHHNYQLNAAIVLKDAYRLLCLVLADLEIAKIADDDRDELVVLRDRFVEDELVHLMISTAVMNRSQDEHMVGLRGDPIELSSPGTSHECGSYVEDVSSDQPKALPLDLREACNKIIHAQHITAELDPVERTAFPPLPHAMILRGQKGRLPWEAVLNIPAYVRATFANFGAF